MLKSASRATRLCERLRNQQILPRVLADAGLLSPLRQTAKCLRTSTVFWQNYLGFRIYQLLPTIASPRARRNIGQGAA